MQRSGPFGLTGVFTLAVMLGVASCTASVDNEPLGLPDSACGILRDLVIPAEAIGLPTSGAVVESAVMVASSDTDNPNGDYCKVTGVVKPVNVMSPGMEFEVNLPATWNRRALQMGGGGYDGRLVTGLTAFVLQPANVDNPLKQGFVTLGSDGGHKGGAGFDGSFGLDDEALLNYGKQSVKKTHDAALEIIRKAYGAAPNRFYFIGGSQGGHEALDAAARYGEDYDGVVAHYPAYNVTMLHLGSMNAAKALYENDGTGWMGAEKAKLLTDAVYASCDALDGIKDGIISDVENCNATFDASSLRCADGTDRGNSCLSDAQLAAVKRIASPYSPGFPIAGMESFPKWPLLQGALFQGGSNFGTVSLPSNPLSGKEALLYSVGDQTVKFIVTRDPQIDAMSFDPAQWQDRITTVAAIMDVTDVSLEKFRARGGKLILTHGTVDDFITPYNTIAYYERQVDQFTEPVVKSFIRFYMVPGLGHGFGPFNAKFDSLKALQNWVENGQAPEGLVATDENPDANRTRPLCEWPTWPKFTGGDGTENSAASFTCVSP